MKTFIKKEFRLATLLLTFLFLGLGLMAFIPGYPILCGAFFVCLGMFQSYQVGREDHDVLYSVLLPVKKTDVVKAKYVAAVILQLAAFAICAVCTVIRMVFLSEAKVYTANALMGANLVFLAFVLLIFAAFNVIFIGGFFKTAYGVGKPFVTFIVVNFVIIGIGETLHHLPGLGWMNALDFSYPGRQVTVLLVGALAYATATAAACKASQKRFERIDL
jgi:hypothetical protein